MQGIIVAILGALSAAAPNPDLVEGEAVAAGPASVRFADGAVVAFLGVDAPAGGFRCLVEDGVGDCAAEGLTMLQETIGGNPVRCEIVDRSAAVAEGRCSAVRKACYGVECQEELEDLAADQLSSGYVVRRSGSGDAAWAEAEGAARAGPYGLWAEPHGGGLIPPGLTSEEGFTGSLRDLGAVERSLRAWCGLGGRSGPTPDGEQQLREAGLEVQPGNPEAWIETPAGNLYLDPNPRSDACTVRVVYASLDRATLTRWASGLEGFRLSGARSDEAGSGVDHFVAETPWGRQTLIVVRLGNQVEFTVSGAL